MVHSKWERKTGYIELLVETLSFYFESSVRFKRTSLLSEPTRGTDFFCFPRINAVIPMNWGEDLKEFILRDKNITDSILKKAIMDGYLFTAFSFPKLFADKTINIDIERNNAKDLLIFWGSKKLKIINFKNKQIHNIVKSRFKDTWFKKEIEIREKPKWDFIPPLKIIRPRVYSEDFILGCSFPRLKRDLQAAYSVEIMQILDKFQEECTFIESGKYSQNIMEHIEGEKANPLRHKLKPKYFRTFLQFVHLLCKQLQGNGKTIKLVFSHGDLQRSNVFFDKNNKKIWVIDWETWGERSEYYDRMSFFYNMRNSLKIGCNIKNFLNDGGSLLNLGRLDMKDLQSSIMIFLLEDILWNLEETKILPEGLLSQGLKNYLEPKNQQEISMLLDIHRVPYQ